MGQDEKKDFQCDAKVLKVLEDRGHQQVHLGKFGWFGKSADDAKGFEIRKYSVEEERYYKSMPIRYEYMDDVLLALIEAGYGDADLIREALSERENKELDYDDIFDELKERVDVPEGVIQIPRRMAG